MLLSSSWKNICRKPIYIYNSCDHYNEKFRVVTIKQGYHIHKGRILEEEAINQTGGGIIITYNVQSRVSTKEWRSWNRKKRVRHNFFC